MAVAAIASDAGGDCTAKREAGFTRKRPVEPVVATTADVRGMRVDGVSVKHDCERAWIFGNQDTRFNYRLFTLEGDVTRYQKDSNFLTLSIKDARGVAEVGLPIGDCAGEHPLYRKELESAYGRLSYRLPAQPGPVTGLRVRVTGWGNHWCDSSLKVRPMLRPVIALEILGSEKTGKIDIRWSRSKAKPETKRNPN